MTRTLFHILVVAALGVPSMVAAQNSAGPANVVTPAPAPREGTVGPEQLRDFALPGTRQAPAPAAEAPQSSTAPPPVVRTVPAQTTPARTSAPPQSTPREQAAPPAEQPSRSEAPVAASPIDLPPPTVSAEPPIAPALEPATSVSPTAVTQPEAQANALLPGWWPWGLLAVLAGIGLALVLRQRRQLAAAGPSEETLERAAFTPPPRPKASAPAPAPPSEAPALPTGMVTTRLRSAQPAALAPAPPPPAVTGGVVSRRLRAWIELDLVVREILFDAEQAVFRLDLIVANGGTAPAGEITLEAVATNAGEQQGAELALFFDRPGAASAAISELAPLAETRLSHELRFPRAAIKAYEAQGRPVFVPVVAFTAVYRTAAGEGRTGAAFLVGRSVPGSEKLAPLLLPNEAGRVLGLDVRRLDEAVRR